MIKYTIFKNRENKANLPKESISRFLINSCKALLVKDLNYKYQMALRNRDIITFKNNFLIEDILGRIEQNVLTVNV